MAGDTSLSAYITRETLTGGTINALFSLLFVFIVFSGQSTVSMTGSAGLLVDSLPQGLAIGLLGSFFPSFLTRNRLRKGDIKTRLQPAPSPLPQHPFLRALLFALLGASLTSLLFGLSYLVGGVAQLSFTLAAIIKVVWGGLLGAVVANIALRLALRDYSSQQTGCEPSAQVR
ncbi:hypothetical protein [uncultured Alteromonas sp.]|jgi:hypothetical protein|uniref:hypothetical protein n=1 Tax=uncultured Alteromonas sp. TaxID=179113 RepID=UPI0025F09760|nr:hypothetical protein [uncultured Alteromonas sp.]